MRELLRGAIRSSSFIRKEIFEILRQPRLVATLVLGPFLILLIFGIGYRAQSSSLRTLYVAQTNSAIPAQSIEQYGKSMGSLITHAGTTDNKAKALDRLRQGQVDLVVVVPGDVTSTLQTNQQGVFTIYHHEIDPTSVGRISYLGWLYVTEVNKQVLRTFVTQAQRDTATAQTSLDQARKDVAALRQTAASGSPARAQLDTLDKAISDAGGKLASFQEIEPATVVSPFRSETTGVATVQPSISDFFAPGVLALLLQHLAITFAALSIVRERNVGTMELFRVSPLSAAEALFGKFLSYMLFGGVIAAILSALLVFGLRMPMLGNWWHFTLVIAAVLFASLAIGFVISIVSQTDSQAVQYSMIVLLASVFFSGFIMSLDMLWEPVRVISWMLPTTYGTLMLRDIALRGLDPNWMLLGGLAAMGAVLMFVSWRLMRRLISSSA